MLELRHKRSAQPAADWLEPLSLATAAAPAAFFVESGMKVKSVPFAESPAMAKDVHPPTCSRPALSPGTSESDADH